MGGFMSPEVATIIIDSVTNFIIFLIAAAIGYGIGRKER
jgi:hypothetical protein